MAYNYIVLGSKRTSAELLLLFLFISV